MQLYNTKPRRGLAEVERYLVHSMQELNVESKLSRIIRYLRYLQLLTPRERIPQNKHEENSSDEIHTPIQRIEFGSERGVVRRISAEFVVT